MESSANGELSYSAWKQVSGQMKDDFWGKNTDVNSRGCSSPRVGIKALDLQSVEALNLEFEALVASTG